MKARITKAVSALTAAAMLSASAVWSAFAYESSGVTNSFTFTDSGITALTDEGGYKISGTDLTINAAGTYVVSGECAEGTIKIKKGTTDVVLILDSLTLTSSTSAPISVNKGSSATIILEGESKLTDAEDPANETSTDEAVADAFEGAAIKVKAGSSLNIEGSGTLTIDASACKNGIKGGETSTITVGSETDSPTINITAANTGLAADGELNIVNGNITVASDNDGIKSAPDEDDTESRGVLNISGGVINVTSGDDGIKGQNEANITGGKITVSAADDGIKSDYVLSIGTKGSEAGPDITITASYEGLEGAAVNLYSGKGSITSSDDGINAANSDLTSYDFAINIYGGEWYINAGGDGLDSNGDLNIYGGFTEVFGSSQNDNAALDYGDSGNGLYVYGGTVIGIGTSGMATVPTSGNYLVFGSGGMGQGGMGGFPGGQGQQGQQGGFPGGQGQQGQQGQQTAAGGISLSKGDTIEIKDASGTVIYSATAEKAASHIVYASDTLTSGDSYTLYINGTEAAAATVATGNGSTSQQPGQPGEGGQSGEQPTPPDGGEGGEPMGFLLGDADNSGEVDVSDVLLVQQFIASWDVKINQMNADIDRDHEITVDDALMIQQIIAGYTFTS